MARPTRDQLADHHRQEWLCERDTAETVPCPPRPKGCGVAAGQTCVSAVGGRPLQGPPAHGARIRLAAAHARPLAPSAA
jgi:hypothetical protein